jgi:hypothetical protein
VYLAFTQELLFGKKSFTNVSVQTSTHRIVKDTTKIVQTGNKVPVSDSLKKDSLVKPAGKGTKPVPAAPKTLRINGKNKNSVRIPDHYDNIVLPNETNS